MVKIARVDYPIHELLKNRWSPRAFSSRPVEREALLSLFEAARWSPSANNRQPWHFIVTTPLKAEPYQRLFETLTERNQSWAKNAPLLVLTVAQREPEPGKINAKALYDLGQAVAHLTVQAGALGLYVRQMGGFDAPRAAENFSLPVGFEPVTVLAVGYLGSPDVLPEHFRQAEFEARARKPQAEFVFDGAWGVALD